MLSDATPLILVERHGCNRPLPTRRQLSLKQGQCLALSALRSRDSVGFIELKPCVVLIAVGFGEPVNRKQRRRSECLPGLTALVLGPSISLQARFPFLVTNLVNRQLLQLENRLG